MYASSKKQARSTLTTIPELASGWGFFGIGILNFGLDRKTPKIQISRESGSRLENPEKKSSGEFRKY